jgi:hypothetical protein
MASLEQANLDGLTPETWTDSDRTAAAMTAIGEATNRPA